MLLFEEETVSQLPVHMVVMSIITTHLVYDSTKLFSAAGFIFLLSLKLDHYITSSWGIISIPIFVFYTLSFLEKMVVFLSRYSYNCKEGQEVSLQAIGFSMIGQVFVLLFHVFLVLKLDLFPIIPWGAVLFPLTMGFIVFSISVLIGKFSFKYACVNLCQYIQFPVYFGLTVSSLLLIYFLTTHDNHVSLVTVAVPVLVAQLAVLVIPCVQWMRSEERQYTFYKEQIALISICFLPCYIAFEILLYLRLVEAVTIPYYLIFLPVYIGLLVQPNAMNAIYLVEYQYE